MWGVKNKLTYYDITGKSCLGDRIQCSGWMFDFPRVRKLKMQPV